MEAEQYQWRKRARVVAYIDLVLSGINLFIVIVFIALTIGVTEEVAKAELVEPDMPDVNVEIKSEARFIVIVLWIVTIILIAFLAFDIWACIRLLNATCEFGGQNPALLHQMIKPWRNANILLIALAVVQAVGGPYPLAQIIGIAIRGGFLFIVLQYMKELKRNVEVGEGSGMLKPEPPMSVP